MRGCAGVIVSLSCFVIIASVGCVKGENISGGVGSKMSSISVGDIPGHPDATLKVLLTENGGQVQTLEGKEALKAKKFTPGTEVKIGIEAYENDKLFASTDEKKDNCKPAVLTLKEGTNKASIKLCKVDGSSEDVSTDGNDNSGNDNNNLGNGNDNSGNGSGSDGISNGGNVNPSDDDDATTGSASATSKDCSGKAVSSISNLTCTTITKELSKSEDIYSSCFSQLKCSSFSEIRCKQTGTVNKGKIFVGCSSSFENSSGCSYQSGKISCGSSSTVAVFVSDISYL